MIIIIWLYLHKPLCNNFFHYKFFSCISFLWAGVLNQTFGMSDSRGLLFEDSPSRCEGLMSASVVVAIVAVLTSTVELPLKTF
jgi:hypothetical protein